MADINTNPPNGWNRWIYARSTYSGIQYPDASFPYLYAPSGGFWSRSIAAHCLIPWLNTPGAFATFLMAGGGTGTIIGSVTGLTAVSLTFEISVHSQIFAVGRGAVPPIMGYCIGNKFKQHVYTRLDVQNDGLGGTIVTNISVDLLQNSRFKRMYVTEGSIVRYTKPANSTNGSVGEYLLTLDFIKDQSPPSNLSFTGNKIDVTIAGNANSKATVLSMDILGLKDNWDIIISKPIQDIPVDAYYKLSQPWCLEDPYLLSGFWIGEENTAQPPVLSSGYNLYRTTHNSPYEEGKFLGIYIWKTDPTSTNVSSTVVATQPIAGASMNDSSGNSWAWAGFGNSPEYNVYPDDKRYREVLLERPDEDGAIVTFQERLQVTNADYKDIIASNPTYLRVEIGTGGYTNRHNWYAPCLKGQYLSIGGKKFKILDHVTFNIIDVSYISADGTTKFDPIKNQNYSLVNQYAWILNEHYEGRISSGNNTGVFKGTVTSVQGNSVFITTDGDTFISTVKRNGLSFMDRYEKNIILSSTLKKCFNKFNGWKLVTDKGEYDINSVDFSSAATDISQPYPIKVILVNATSDIIQNNRTYIAFDKTFKTYANVSKESGFSFYGTVKAALSGTTQWLGLLVSNVLCMDCQFDSDPYKLDITPNDRIGMTEGYLFGLEANGSAQSNYNQLMFFTTPRTVRGVASLFHNLRQEDWAAYHDAVTGKLTVRRGSMNFTEYPMKEMVVIGKPSLRVPTEYANPMNLDQDSEILRRLWVKFVSGGSNDDISVMFGIGSSTNIYGFYVSGDGIVNLNMLTRQGILPGSIPSTSYTGFDYNVSPVYIYKPNYYQNLDSIKVDVGVATSDGPIYFNNAGSSISNVELEYVKENQTVSSDIGFFDIVRFSNGENIVIYGQGPNAFKIDNILNNSKTNGTNWSNPNAVMVIGTFDDSFNWSSPLVGRIDDEDNTNQYPLMILNSVDYLGCIYNSMNETFAIFVRCEMKRSSDTLYYLGCFIISIYQMNHKRIICEPQVSSNMPAPLKIIWRPPILEDSFVTDTTKSWTDPSNVIEDGYSFVALSEEAMGVHEDKFIRVMGSGATNSQVQNQNEFGIISTAILADGSYAVFYDSELGVKGIFSNDNGLTWRSPNVIFAKDAKSGLLLDQYLFFIAPEGIRMKYTQITDIYDARNISLMSAGIDKTSAEINLQGILDKREYISIGSGQIEPQRLSGYISPEGTIKVFFYDANNLLKCMESTDSYEWMVTNNF